MEQYADIYLLRIHFLLTLNYDAWNRELKIKLCISFHALLIDYSQ